MRKIIISCIYVCLAFQIMYADSKTALVWAVGQHAAPTLPQNGAVRDADSIAGALCQMGYLVKVLKNEHATGLSIRQALAEIDSTTQLTIVVLGNGVHLGGQTYFLPYDANNYDPSGWLSIEELINSVWLYGAKTSLIFTDICRKPIDIAAGQNIQAKTFKIPEDPQRRFVVIESCRPGQLARESPTGHGVCSWYFWKLLSDPDVQALADLDQSGYLAINELYTFLSRKTSDANIPSANMPQNPVLHGKQSKRAVFCTISKPPAGTEPPPRPLPSQKYKPSWQVEMAKIPKQRRFRRFWRHDGLRNNLDLGNACDTLHYTCILLHDRKSQWSRRLYCEINHHPDLRRFFMPDSRFHLVVYPQHTPVAILETEFLDTHCFIKGSKDPLYQWLLATLLTKCARSPSLILLETGLYEGRTVFTRYHFWQGYHGPENLAGNLRRLPEFWDYKERGITGN